MDARPQGGTVIIVAGELRLDPELRDAYLAAVADVAPLARRTSGCLDFVQAADPLEPDRINVYERWDSDEALAAFRAQGGPDEPGAPMPELRSASVRKYRVASEEAP
jgi:quinol monooxygenase YgiN